MKLFLVSMVRDEIDILPSFLSHIDSLFDSGCLIDHLSSDGSELLMQEFTSSRKGWDYQPLQTPAYTQAEISTEIMHRAFQAGADAVFFLDADEFIAGKDCAVLEKSLESIQANKQIGQMRWRNCLPADYQKPFSLSEPAWLCDLAVHKKVVVPKWLYERFGKQFGVNQGNHSLRLPESIRLPEVPVAEILHFPIRSRGQFVRKINVSYDSQMHKPGQIVAPHIKMLFELLTQQEFTSEHLNSIAINYGAPAGPLLTQEDLRKRGYQLKVPKILMTNKN